MELKRLDSIRAGDLGLIESPVLALGLIRNARLGHCRIRGLEGLLTSCMNAADTWDWNHVERGWQGLTQRLMSGEWVLVRDQNVAPLRPAYQQVDGQWQAGPDLQGNAFSLPASLLAAATTTRDPAIEALDLADTARTAAYALKRAHPEIRFTSGRRSKADQARAMASNVVKNRKWIEQTYTNTTLRKKCQDWVDKNPDKKTQSEIADGLLTIFNASTDHDLGTISKHLSGQAFDVQPVTKDAEAIKKTIRGLPGLGKFLDKEGGLVRWHAQF